jgi:CubicO group peptidase (beta-lactamase class C family)
MKTIILHLLALTVFANLSQVLAQKSFQLPEPVTEIHNQINVGVFPQVELISIVQTISRYPSVFSFLMANDSSGYKTEVINHFQSFQNHPAVQMFNRLSLQPRMLNFSAPSFIMLHASEKLELRTDIEQDDFVFQRAGGMDSLKVLLENLQDFAGKSGFNVFFLQHHHYYRTIIKNTVQNLGQTNYISELENFYGKQQKSYNIALVSLYNHVGFGNSLLCPDGRREIYNVMGPQKVENELPIFGDENFLKYMIRHEFSHPFVNPLTEKYWDYISDYSTNYDSIPEVARKNVCGDWQECINEFVIRSVTTHLAAKTSPEEGRNYYEKEKSRGVSYLDSLIKRINIYDLNREKYPTFESFYYAILTIFRSSNCAKPQTPGRQEILHEYLESYHKQGTFNGVVLVAEKGKVILSEGYGFANIEHEVKNTPSTKFILASITKVFTASIVMKLADQGKITLDTRLADFLKWYRTDTGNKITVRHLLNHTSGIPNYFDLRNKTVDDVMKDFGNGPINKTEFAKKYCQGDLEFEPGTKWNYNNSAYFLLGLIIEEVAGTSYENVLQNMIFGPLEMHNSGDIQPNPSKIIPGLATGYLRNFSAFSYPSYWNMSTAYAAGSLYSNVTDLLKFDQALYNDKFLSEAAREAMFTPNLNNYGCGWELRESPVGKNKTTKKVRTHEGFLFGWHTRFYQIPDEQYLIVILSNGGSSPIENMINGVTDILYDRPVQNMKPLISNEIWKSLQTGNLVETIENCDKIYKTDIETWSFDERDLNRLGYVVLLTDKPAAIKIFSFITRIYPQSWNAWDSLGESFAAAGNNEEAIAAYKKSVEINPENKAGIEMLKVLQN